jgi:hypothetical protein
MFSTIASAVLLYRVTSARTVWPNPVKGHGAYFISKGGNRSNRPDQLTVYCAEDALVALTEGAFYQALAWHEEIASSRLRALTYPFESEHLFWAFRLDPGPAVLELETSEARARFGYPPHFLLNPSREYAGTQALADEVRSYAPPPSAPHPRPEGLKAPSIRAPRSGAFQPSQLCLFVRDIPGCEPYEHRATLVAKMRLQFQFLEKAPGDKPVNYDSVVIDWSRPRFRLSEIAGEPLLSPVPAFAARPKAKDYRPNRWYRIGINY